MLTKRTRCKFCGSDTWGDSNFVICYANEQDRQEDDPHKTLWFAHERCYDILND